MTLREEAEMMFQSGEMQQYVITSFCPHSSQRSMTTQLDSEGQDVMIETPGVFAKELDGDEWHKAAGLLAVALLTTTVYVAQFTRSVLPRLPNSFNDGLLPQLQLETHIYGTKLEVGRPILLVDFLTDSRVCIRCIILAQACGQHGSPRHAEAFLGVSPVLRSISNSTFSGIFVILVTFPLTGAPIDFSVELLDRLSPALVK